MDIHLINEYTSDNLGDAVIYESIVQLASPHQVRSHMPDRQRRRVRGLLGEFDPAPFDAFISVGGDIFNNARPNLVTREFMGNLFKLARSPADRTFLFGQSIPQSCKGLSFNLLSSVLRRLSSVTVRDELSHERLQKAGVNSRLSFDTAFAYRIHSGALKAGQLLFDAHGLMPCTTALISVRGFDAMYPHDNEKFQDKMARFCELMIHRGHVPAILCQADAKGADSDRAVIQELRRKVPGIKMMSPFEMGGVHDPVDAFVGAVALANSVVAVRYHTTVIRLLAGRHAYNLHYSIKGRDLSRRLGLPGTALESFEPEQAMTQLELTADRVFDPAEQRRDVEEAFASSLARVIPAVPEFARV